MRPDYDGVKFYSRDDWSLGENLKLADPIILTFSKENAYADINAVIELYNIQQLYETGATLVEWTEADYEKRKRIVMSMTPVLGKFLSKIDNGNFYDYEQKVAIGYFDDFWELFVRFKVYNRITSDIFLDYLQKTQTGLRTILKHKELVAYYDEQIAAVLRESRQAAGILASKFLEKSSDNFYIPNSIAPSEYDSIFQRHIDSDKVNPNLWQLIMNAQSTKECPISDRLRLNAKRANEQFWRENSDTIHFSEHGILVGFADQDELKKCEQHGNDFHITYDIKWLEKNLEYPTILNNFIYLFEMFDMSCRSSLVSVKSGISPFEDLFSVKGVRFYPRGTLFNTEAILANFQMALYYDFLNKHGINLEDIFKWFFEEYLLKEFGVGGFSMISSSSSTSYVEKCRNIAAEMDGVLKQFRMFVIYEEIDRELYEMSSEHMVIDTIPSLINHKYAYPMSKDVANELRLLFSNQTVLSVTDRTEAKYSTLYDLLRNERVLLSDFKHFQKPAIEWLVEHKCLLVDKEDIVTLAQDKVRILKDLYDHDVICIHHLKLYANTIEEMVASGELRISDTLFTEPERDYLNYELNKSTFSDGLDLRNKYAHSTYPKDEQEQRKDYMELLKVMVLVITKINDEFCERGVQHEL